ncbi:MAG TPA: arsenite methyltransferase [Acidimicrobiales bacterium]|nr:arsenite methyltransferase [Acidimicrobiales bacterium]
MSQQPDIREVVRKHYAGEAARFAARSSDGSCCGNGTSSCGGESFGASLYADEAAGVPVVAVGASLGCGVPTAVADLHPGEVLLDLGSGAGADVLIAARRVSPGGRAIGLDMTAEMLELARKHAAEAGADNVEFLEGYLEEIPLPDASVDVVLSNCVINLAADKDVVLAEASRVLRPGGRFAVTDIVADADMDQATRKDMEQWAGCLAGALTEAEYRTALVGAGFADVEVVETHRVHDHAFSAIVRARKPL